MNTPQLYDYRSCYGETVTVLPKLAMYAYNDNLYVGLDYIDSDCECWLSYTDITVNVGKLPFLESAIDINNNGQEIMDFLMKNGFGQLTGKTIQSGFCTFPVFRFNEEKLKEIDGQVFSQYEKAHNIHNKEKHSLAEVISRVKEEVALNGKDAELRLEKTAESER